MSDEDKGREGDVSDIGQLRMERTYDHDLGRDALRIVQADPRVRILSDVIGHRDDSNGRLIGTFGRTGFLTRVGDVLTRVGDVLTRVGDVLTIADDYGQRFIYRIHWDDYAHGGYLAEWPD